MSMSEILTISDAAELLRVSEKTIRRMIEAGDIPASKIGGQWRITRAACERLVEPTNTTPPPDSAPQANASAGPNNTPIGNQIDTRA